MRLQPAPELLEVLLAINQKLVRICKRNFAKANLIASAQLSRNWKIDRNHVRDFRITANGLAISEQEDRFPIWRNLDRAGSNCFRDKIDKFISFQLRTFETHPHSIRIGRNNEFVGREALNRYIVKTVPIRAANNAQSWFAFGRARPVMRGAASGFWPFDHQFFAFSNEDWMTGGQRCRPRVRIEFAAAPGHESFIGEPQLQTAKGDLQPSRRFFIANEQIGDAQGVGIKRATRRDAKLPKSRSSEILDCRQKSGAESSRIHIVDLSNSSREIARKRTRSPARRSAGGSFWGSNKRNGVRPIRFQPPGD